ncbi:MAG: hypothetical protein PPP58_09925 [Natronomonas sp.]
MTSVPTGRLSELLNALQATLEEKSDDYDRGYERIDGARGRVYYLFETGHWEDLGAELGIGEHELEVLRHLHGEQFRQDGRRLGRTAEFESALELRDVVAVSMDPEGPE